MIASAKKVAAGQRGEDAWFVSRAGCGALGVADGVGGWGAEGVDAAAYALLLMERCTRALEGPNACRSALAALEYAQATTKLPGSSTALVAQLRPGGLLEVVSLGDSGLRLIRGGRVEWETPVQEHAWNCPYQLSHPRFVANTDTAADAAVADLRLWPGDVLVAGTDGLWDNLWEEELTAAVAAAGLGGGGGGGGGGGAAQGGGAGGGGEAAARALARRLVAKAEANALDPRYRGPWAVELEAHGKVQRGGARGGGGRGLAWRRRAPGEGAALPGALAHRSPPTPSRGRGVLALLAASTAIYASPAMNPPSPRPPGVWPSASVWRAGRQGG
ncbi:MAG: phosphatase 2C-like domain-containing protein [Monoraphidium minutum]|nr:MAG: phosphatase 2C-like domain-containing protein [Monoraphidium minutum]